MQKRFIDFASVNDNALLHTYRSHLPFNLDIEDYAKVKKLAFMNLCSLLSWLIRLLNISTSYVCFIAIDGSVLYRYYTSYLVSNLFLSTIIKASVKRWFQLSDIQFLHCNIFFIKRCKLIKEAHQICSLHDTKFCWPLW